MKPFRLRLLRERWGLFGERKLLCMLAHPDDESIGLGGILAKYSREGVSTHLITATRGEKGRKPDGGDAKTSLGEIRERELRAAAAILGVGDVRVLGYRDGEVDRVDRAAAVRTLVAGVRQVRPDVVLVFPPDGVDGHPDHVAMSQLAISAVVAAADPAFDPTAPAHVVAKVYLFVLTAVSWSAYEAGFGVSRIVVEGTARRPQPWPDWAVTTAVDTAAYCATAWDAVQCHASQIAMREGLRNFGGRERMDLWGIHRFCRLSSLARGGSERERDLFEGLA